MGLPSLLVAKRASPAPRPRSPRGVFSARIDEALALAATAHHDQKRKGSGVPYIQHPVHVAMLLLRHGFDEAVIVAALLHDVVEDSDVELGTIEARFGRRVARLVGGATEQKAEGGVLRPWRARKEEALAALRRAGRDGVALKAADALHNCCSTLAHVREIGPAAWTRFHAPADQQAWYYAEIARIVRAKLGDHPLARELGRVVRELARVAHASDA